VKFCGVMSETDVWRAATLMLKRYGERAFEESAARADEPASSGDDNGVAVGRRIWTPSGDSSPSPRPVRSTDLPRHWRRRLGR
jgi:hypothetical protein